MDPLAIGAAALLFAAGLALGMLAERRDVRWATAWGRWVVARVLSWVERNPRALRRIALLIWAVNAVTVGLVVVACYLPPLSLLLLLAAGVNTGVGLERLGGTRALLVFLMPHAWIEIPAVITGAAAALQATAFQLGLLWFDSLADPVWALAFFLRATVWLLLGAAILEAMLLTVRARA
jgi:uncharacterized membrane protein SpoIIM required for sporulation